MEIALLDLSLVFLAGGGFLVSMGFGVQLINRKEGVALANRLLGLLLVFIALSTLNLLLSLVGLYSQYQYLYFLPLVYSLSIGPLFYFFVRSKVDPRFQLQTKHWPHAILPLLQIAFYFSIGFRSAQFKSMIWRDFIGSYLQYVEEGLFIASVLFYIVKAKSLLAKVPGEKWKIPVYGWLQGFANTLLVLLLIHSTYEIVDWFLYGLYEFNLFNETWYDLPLKLADAAIPLWLAYNAMKYQHLAWPIVAPRQEKSVARPHSLAHIHHYLKEEEPFLDPEFNLNSLSRALEIPKNDLSKLISSSDLSFRRLLNSYRLDYFKKIALDPANSHLSLLGLAFESGFNSKASFNRVFKEELGETPSQFLKRSQKGSVSKGF